MPPSFAFCGSNAVHWPWPHPHTKNTAADICTSPRGCMCTKTFLSSHHHKRPSHLLPGSMGQAVAKAKQGAESATQKTEEGKVVPKSNEAKELIKFMDKKYESKVQNATSFEDFYHAIYEIIELFCEARGQLQYKIPSKEDLQKAYEAVHTKEGENLTKAQFMRIAENVVRVDSFTIGRAAIDALIVLFGAPVCALLVKRIVPGLKSLSDDVVIPMATSGAAVYLAKTNKL